MGDDNVLDASAEPHLAVLDDSNVSIAVPATFDEAGSGGVDVVEVVNEYHGAAWTCSSPLSPF